MQATRRSVSREPENLRIQVTANELPDTFDIAGMLAMGVQGRKTELTPKVIVDRDRPFPGVKEEAGGCRRFDQTGRSVVVWVLDFRFTVLHQRQTPNFLSNVHSGV